MNTQVEVNPPSLRLTCIALMNITFLGPSQRKPEGEQLLLKPLHCVPVEKLHKKHRPCHCAIPKAPVLSRKTEI